MQNIPESMKVAVMLGIGKMGFEERSVPKPKPDEVLIKVEYVGICGSDIHYYEEGRIGHYIVEPPFVLGHEAGGTVVALGSEVENLKIGDKVALEPGITCGKCEFCVKGEYNLCPDVVFFATPPVDGVFAEYVAHPARLSFKIPDSMDTMEAALIEPLSIGFYAAKQGKAEIGQSAVVFGAGCIGLSSVLALKARGIDNVYVVDIVQKRLDKALEIGAAGVINAKNQDVIKRSKEITNGRGFDLAIETAGTEKTMTQAIEIVRKGSHIVMVGYASSGEMTLPTSLFTDKELTMDSVFRYRHIYPSAIEAVASGRIDIKSVVTDVFEFEDIQNAMDKTVSDKANIVKSVVKIS